MAVFLGGGPFGEEMSVLVTIYFCFFNHGDF